MIPEAALHRFAEARGNISALQRAKIRHVVPETEVRAALEKQFATPAFWNGIVTDINNLKRPPFADRPPSHGFFFNNYDPVTNPSAWDMVPGKYFMLNEAVRYARDLDTSLNEVVSFDHTPTFENKELGRAMSMAQRKLFALRDYPNEYHARRMRYEKLLADPYFWRDFDAFAKRAQLEDLWDAMHAFQREVAPQFTAAQLLKDPITQSGWFHLTTYLLTLAEKQTPPGLNTIERIQAEKDGAVKIFLEKREDALPKAPDWLREFIPDITYEQAEALKKIDRDAVMILLKQPKMIRGGPEFLRRFGIFIYRANTDITGRSALEVVDSVKDEDAMRGFGYAFRHMKRDTKLDDLFKLGKATHVVAQRIARTTFGQQHRGRPKKGHELNNIHFPPEEELDNVK